jgi:hypothetical protein
MKTIRPSVILSTVMFALFVSFGGGMALGRISVTGFGIAFVALCFLTAVVSAMTASGAAIKEGAAK